MTKKKHDKNAKDDIRLDERIPHEDVQEEAEDGEENEQEDELAEDESDLEMIRNLEGEDARMALATCSLDEIVGFNPMIDSTMVPEASQTRFSVIMDMPAEEVEHYAWKRLSALQKWMMALASSKHGFHAQFREICYALIKMRKPPRELCMPDIYLELVHDYIQTKEYDEASTLLDKFVQAFPNEEAAGMRVRGLMLIDKGCVEEGKDLLEQLAHLPFNRQIKGFEDDNAGSDRHDIDGVLPYEIGCSLVAMGHYDLAIEYFKRARNLANMNNNYALTLAIEDAQANLQKRMRQED